MQIGVDMSGGQIVADEVVGVYLPLLIADYGVERCQARYEGGVGMQFGGHAYIESLLTAGIMLVNQHLGPVFGHAALDLYLLPGVESTGSVAYVCPEQHRVGVLVGLEFYGVEACAAGPEVKYARVY